MKYYCNLIFRFTAIALLTGGLSSGSSAFGQDEPATSKPNKGPEPMSAMAPTGVKPSKAELAKMEAEKAGKTATKPAAGKSAAMAKMDAQDSAFMMEAAKGNASEIAMGKMAEKKGKSAEVKNIGKMMVADHTAANSELMALAKTKGVKIDAKPAMAKMNDANFDSAYLAQMVTDHQKVIAAFEKEAKSGKDADAKGWAKKMLPALKKHLKMVQDAQKKMPKAG